MTAGWGAARPDMPDRMAVPYPGGAGLREGTTGWVLVEDAPARGPRACAARAGRAGVDRLHVLVEDEAGGLARRATTFAPAPQVWQVRGREVSLAAPGPIGPARGLARRRPRGSTDSRVAGVEAVVESGVLTGEVLGLEVARVVSDAEGTRLEVGVGKHDRHAERIMGGDVPTQAALAAAVAAVREHRRAGAPHHPLNRLASERRLRVVLVERPARRRRHPPRAGAVARSCVTTSAATLPRPWRASTSRGGRCSSCAPPGSTWTWYLRPPTPVWPTVAGRV